MFRFDLTTGIVRAVGFMCTHFFIGPVIFAIELALKTRLIIHVTGIHLRTIRRVRFQGAPQFMHVYLVEFSFVAAIKFA